MVRTAQQLWKYGFNQPERRKYSCIWLICKTGPIKFNWIDPRLILFSILIAHASCSPATISNFYSLSYQAWIPMQIYATLGWVAILLWYLKRWLEETSSSRKGNNKLIKLLRDQQWFQMFCTPDTETWFSRVVVQVRRIAFFVSLNSSCSLGTDSAKSPTDLSNFSLQEERDRLSTANWRYISNDCSPIKHLDRARVVFFARISGARDLSNWRDDIGPPRFAPDAMASELWPLPA